MKLNLEFKTNKLWEGLSGVLAFLMFVIVGSYIFTLIGDISPSNNIKLGIFILFPLTIFTTIASPRYFFPRNFSLKVFFWLTFVFAFIPSFLITVVGSVEEFFPLFPYEVSGVLSFVFALCLVAYTESKLASRAKKEQE